MKVFVNNQAIKCSETDTILDVCRRQGVHIPILCEFASLNHRPGTCRMCLVEVVGVEDSSLVTACNTLVETNTHQHSLRACKKCSSLTSPALIC